jgi:hypothetical protein
VTASWKTVPLFISSTFRDMHAERDHLVNKSFSRVRLRISQVAALGFLPLRHAPARLAAAAPASFVAVKM